MGKQYNKILKRKRRKAYLSRKKEQEKIQTAVKPMAKKAKTAKPKSETKEPKKAATKTPAKKATKKTAKKAAKKTTAKKTTAKKETKE